VKSSARVLRQLGADISRIQESGVRISGSRLQTPDSRLNCGNSGTTARLMLGILAGRSRSVTHGDASLRRRPMRRVTEPLRQMGADIKERGDGLPLTIRGGKLRALMYSSPVAKRSSEERDLVRRTDRPGPGHDYRTISVARPHGATVRPFGAGHSRSNGAISYQPSAVSIPSFDISVPGDISSAAFMVAAAVFAEAGELLVGECRRKPDPDRLSCCPRTHGCAHRGSSARRRR